jgi:O-antigen ligase
VIADRLFRAIAALFVGCSILLPYVGGYPAAYVVMILILVLSVWHYATPWRVPLDPGALLLLLAFGILAIVFAIDGRPGSTDYIFALNFILFALYAPLTGALGRVAKPGNTRVVAWLALACVLVAYVVAIVQIAIVRLPRAEGIASDAIHSAMVALLLGFIALMGWSTTTTGPGWRRHLLLLGPVLGIGTVLLSGSRGPLLVTPFLVLAALFLARLNLRAILATGLLIAVQLAAFFVLLPEHMQRFLAMGGVATELAAGAQVESDVSMAIRLKIYDASYRAFLESPWLGHGWAMKAPVAAKYAPGILPDINWAHLHSDIANFGVSAGVVGFVVLLMVLIAPLISVRSSPRDGQYPMRLYGTVILVLGYAVCGITNLLFGFEFTTTFYIAVAAILVAWCRDAPAGGRP